MNDPVQELRERIAAESQAIAEKFVVTQWDPADTLQSMEANVRTSISAAHLDGLVKVTGSSYKDGELLVHVNGPRWAMSELGLEA